MRRSAVWLVVALVGCKKQDEDPGALVAVSMDGTVGVVLDEIPEALREPVAAALLAQPAATWEARARRQVDYTYYRFTFRSYFYANKGQLPLPPSELWDVTMEGSPRRATIDGHDVVAIDYHFASTLLADVASTERAEPKLAEVGGTWDEPFVPPLDPELLFQRTGYACMDEADYPLDSVDAENAWLFYDQDCTIDADWCHLSEPVDQDCVDALKARSGHLQTKVHFERLEWDEKVADAVRFGDVTTDRGADLVVYQPALENTRVEYRYFDASDCAVAEGCVGGTGWRRLLMFDSINHNVGSDALHIGDVNYYIDAAGDPTDQHNLYEYSECHDHYHFNHYGDFTFGAGDATIGGKRAFCLISTNRLSNNEQTPLGNDYGACEYQGIEAGWGDMYQAGLACQWIDITEVATPTSGPLSCLANPDGVLCEGTPILEHGDPKWVPTDFTTEDGEPVDTIACDAVPGADANNLGTATVAVPAQGQGLITAACARGQVGPLRDCGFAAGEVGACTAGTPTVVSVTLSEPSTVRICETSAALGTGVACTYLDAVANEVLAASGDVSFDCPAQRDGGAGGYAVYTSPLGP